METVHLQLPPPAAAAYDVVIGHDLFAALGSRVHQAAPAVSVALISDSNVAPLYLAAARQSLESAGYRVIAFIFPAGEAQKTFATSGHAFDALLSARVERSTPVVALGGGVVGDLAGFVSATMLRGTPFIQVPTTLLAAVDASVGGKVGIDHPAGKNLIGAFHQPRLVLTDVATFASLPARELRCGLAECIKHGIIRDASLFHFIDQQHDKILAGDPAPLIELVRRNVEIKAQVVMEDPFEHGVRALLNLGHTFGHAVENVYGYRDVQHGEAVALGMVAAAQLALALGKISAADAAAIARLIAAVGLPTALADLDVPRIYAAMYTDKKVSGGRLRLILPTGLGSAEIVTGVPEEKITAALAALGRRA